MRLAVTSLLAVAVLVGGAAAGASQVPKRPSSESPHYFLRVARADGTHGRRLFKGEIWNGELVLDAVVDLAPRQRRTLMVHRRLVAPEETCEVLRVADLRGQPIRDVIDTCSLGPTSWWIPFERPWAPDGRRFAVTVREGDCASAVYSASADGDDLQRLAPGALFVWGPKSRSFLISEATPVSEAARCDEWSFAVRLVYVDSGGRHVVADGATEPLAVSPRGDLVAYRTFEPYRKDDFGTLHIARTDGTGDVTTIVGGTDPAWSPDGRHLALITHAVWYAPGGRSLVVADSEGRRRRVIATPSTGLLGAPVWSPRGNRIAYRRRGNTFASIRPNGRGRRIVAHAYIAGHFWWSPDGRSFYYDGWARK